jgi:hypothetical protein
MQVIKPEKIIEKITNLKTGEEYKDDNEWKSKGVPEDRHSKRYKSSYAKP